MVLPEVAPWLTDELLSQAAPIAPRKPGSTVEDVFDVAMLLGILVMAFYGIVLVIQKFHWRVLLAWALLNGAIPCVIIASQAICATVRRRRAGL